MYPRGDCFFCPNYQLCHNKIYLTPSKYCELCAAQMVKRLCNPIWIWIGNMTKCAKGSKVDILMYNTVYIYLLTHMYILQRTFIFSYLKHVCYCCIPFSECAFFISVNKLFLFFSISSCCIWSLQASIISCQPNMHLCKFYI